MSEIPVWPLAVLRPQSCNPNPVPFSRGSTTLGGTKPSINTDLGYWTIKLENILLRNSNREQWRTWNAIRSMLCGTAGRIAVPARSSHSAPYASGRFEQGPVVPHSDGSDFSDGSEYEQSAISIVSVGVTPIGVTTIRMRIINASDDLSGVRFSYQHALYETGRVLDVDGDILTMEITPSVRAVIPHGADLEFDDPTCLCNLASDSGMDVAQPLAGKQLLASVEFVEDTDYWNRLALGLEV